MFAPCKHAWGLLGNIAQQGQWVFVPTSTPICAWAAQKSGQLCRTCHGWLGLPWSQKLLCHNTDILTIPALTTGTCWLESKVAPQGLINFVSNLDQFIPDYLFHTITTPASSSHGEITPHIFTKCGVWGGQGIKAGLS